MVIVSGSKIAFFFFICLESGLFTTSDANTRVMYVVDLNMLIEGEIQQREVVIEPLSQVSSNETTLDYLRKHLYSMDFPDSKLRCKNNHLHYCSCELQVVHLDFNNTNDDLKYVWDVSSNGTERHSIVPVNRLHLQDHVFVETNVSQTDCIKSVSYKIGDCYLDSVTDEILYNGNYQENATFDGTTCNKSLTQSAYICQCSASRYESCEVVGKMNFSVSNEKANIDDITVNETTLNQAAYIFISFTRQYIRLCKEKHGPVIIVTEVWKRLTFLEDPHNLKIIDFIVSIISLLSLFGTIFVFSTCQELRNLHGRNLMALSITLFFSQILFLHDSGVANDRLCAAIGGFLHYAWLSVFLWTSVMAFDLARTFRFKSAISLYENDDINRRFVVHALVAWGVPAAVVMICLVSNLHDIDTLYGTVVNGGVCMVSRYTAVYGLFVPFGVVFIFNMSCFAFIIHGIETSRISNANESKAPMRDRTHCFIYGKISVLLGASWIICVIATLNNSREFWFTFSIMTNIQGIGIFFSFVILSRRVRSTLRRNFTNHSSLVSLPSINATFRDIQNRKSSALTDFGGSLGQSSPCDSAIFEDTSEKEGSITSNS